MLTVLVHCKRGDVNNNLAPGDGVYGLLATGHFCVRLLAFHFRRNPESVKHTDNRHFPKTQCSAFVSDLSQAGISGTVKRPLCTCSVEPLSHLFRREHKSGIKSASSFRKQYPWNQSMHYGSLASLTLILPVPQLSREQTQRNSKVTVSSMWTPSSYSIFYSYAPWWEKELPSVLVVICVFDNSKFTRLVEGHECFIFPCKTFFTVVKQNLPVHPFPVLSTSLSCQHCWSSHSLTWNLHTPICSRPFP